ncbi:MAG: helix-turn-helix transcriptional regulator [Phycisphaerae bacterium]
MRIPQTSEPLWYGKKHTRCRLLRFVGAHHVGHYNRIDPHHLPCWEVALVETGSLDLLVGRRAVSVKAGQMLAVPPRTTLQSGEGRNAGLFYWVGIDPPPEPPLPEEPWLRQAVVPLEKTLAAAGGDPLAAGPAVLAAAHRMVELCVEGTAPTLVRAGAALELVGRVAEALTSPRPLAEGRSDRLAPALMLIHSAAGEQPTVEQLAEACDMGRASFAELFRRVVGQTPAQYANQVRIERAREMLATGDRTVTEIATRLGFSSSQYFASVFRKFTGTSPSAYRGGRTNSADSGN